MIKQIGFIQAVSPPNRAWIYYRACIPRTYIDGTKGKITYCGHAHDFPELAAKCLVKMFQSL